MEQCKTLGEETYFEFSYFQEILIIKYGFTVANQTEIKIENALILNVIDRINYLKIANPENLRTVGYYSLTHWKECPQTQHCPYIAKLVLDVFPIETLNRIISENKLLN
ncbi:hypothetical protein [Flavobacterium sp.]|jgi:hypothetical protein|uniref:hypothetical protein n=1 Tax=Flavobacterium sp. TaxID=239 RepID=UPI0037BEF14F